MMIYNLLPKTKIRKSERHITYIKQLLLIDKDDKTKINIVKRNSKSKRMGWVKPMLLQ